MRNPLPLLAALAFAAAAAGAQAPAVGRIDDNPAYPTLPAGAPASGPAAPAAVTSVSWVNDLLFYGDNTEFFDQFREGDTTLGAYLKSYLDTRIGPRTGVLTGVFVNHRSGADSFYDPVKPILSFRYHTATSMGILGSLEPGQRHGFIDPLSIYLLELTRPIEYGAQWIENRDGFKADVFIDWQRLVVPPPDSRREVFDYGGTLAWRLAGPAWFDVQAHGWHQGGQPAGTSSTSAPIEGTVAYAYGPRLQKTLGALGPSSLRIYAAGSQDSVLSSGNGHLIGSGLYAQGSIQPWELFQLYGIQWVGHNYHSQEGDPVYDSRRLDGTIKTNRVYQEIGIVKRAEIDPSCFAEASGRAHWVQGVFAYSYRLNVGLRFDVSLLRRQA